MIFRNILLGLLILFFFTASDPFFGTKLDFKRPPPIAPGEMVEIPWKPTNRFDKYLSDYDDRIADEFKITPFFRSSVNFWFLIYTQYSSEKIVVHDRNNLGLIYGILDFSPMHRLDSGRSLWSVKQQAANKVLERIKRDLSELSAAPFSPDAKYAPILQSLKQANLKLPSTAAARKIFFNELKSTIRTQTGQQDFIQAGIYRSLPYRRFLKKYFRERSLPTELLAIPFLESSFNPIAESKVAARGAWQFMPWIANHYLPRRDFVDYRSNVGVASIAAAFLLSENRRIMGSWDLTVTSYNSGTKHLLRSKRKLNKPNASLEDIIRESDSKHFGFASKNFYSEFLALVHALAYQDYLFSLNPADERDDKGEELLFFMAKCSMNLKQTLDDQTLSDVQFHNHQLKDLGRTIPRGKILTTKSSLPLNKFLRLEMSQLIKSKPREWSKLYLRNQSCSTR